MLDALFLSNTLNLLFVLIKCEVSQARSTITTSPVSRASCYIKRGTLLHHTGQVVTSYGARCYIIRGTLLHQTGHVVTSYGASCYIIRGTLLHHTGHVATSYGARCYRKECVNITVNGIQIIEWSTK